MSWLSPYRWLLYGALAVALWGWHWNDKRIAVNDAIAEIQAEQTAAALVASEANRVKEKALNLSLDKVRNDYAKEKSRRAADAVVAAGKLRDLEAALDSAASADSTATGGADADPRLDIIAQCARAAVRLDEAVKELASQTRGLQAYARNVCMTP